jgi:hypothetical protein
MGDDKVIELKHANLQHQHSLARAHEVENFIATSVHDKVITDQQCIHRRIPLATFALGQTEEREHIVC